MTQWQVWILTMARFKHLNAWTNKCNDYSNLGYAGYYLFPTNHNKLQRIAIEYLKSHYEDEDMKLLISYFSNNEKR